MRQILDLTQQMANAQFQASQTQNIPLRAFFEGQGTNVGWNDRTHQFSLNGQWFDSDPFLNLDGRLHATYQQLLDLEKILRGLPQYADGGYIDRDQIAIVHQGERVLTREQNDLLEAGMLAPLNISQISTDQFTDLLRNSSFGRGNPMDAIVNRAVNHTPPIHTIGTPPTIHIENHGVTSSEFLDELPRVMGVIARGEAKNEVNRYNNKQNTTSLARGTVGGVRAT